MSSNATEEEERGEEEEEPEVNRLHVLVCVRMSTGIAVEKHKIVSSQVLLQRCFIQSRHFKFPNIVHKV